MEMTALGAVHGPPGRPALRRHEAEAGPGLHAGRDAGAAAARRADRRRRSAVAPRAVADHPRPGARAGAAGAGQHLLPGRGRPLRPRHRPATGAGCWPRARPRASAGVADGRDLPARPAQAGETARDLQARLLAMPQVVDAVPEAGRVRVVLDQRRAAAPRWRAAWAPGYADAGPLRGRLHGAAARDGDGPGVRGPDRRRRQPTRDRRRPRRAARWRSRALVRRFGAFTAVDHISFEVRRGEIFGLLGPNGAGKTTTFRMLCGLLPATGGELRVAGVDLRHARASARGADRLRGAEVLALRPAVGGREPGFLRQRLRPARRAEARAHRLGAGRVRARRASPRLPSGQLPGGYKQRLAMAAALLHEPEMLFLDEPTSGADPLARREFWRRITALGRAGRHRDRHHPLHGRGRVLRPHRHPGFRPHAGPGRARPRSARRGHAAAGETPTMEDAFIAIVEASRAAEAERGKAAA